MGTNYYLRDKNESSHKCEKCGHVNGERHIGKSSYGWHFSLHVIPEEGINTLADWKKLFYDDRYFIQDEYGDDITPNYMLEIIENRRRVKLDFPYTHYNGITYTSLEDYAIQNGLTIGYNNLFMHTIDDGHCVGNGDGPYDYITGGFS